jgi:hypothetical protein
LDKANPSWHRIIEKEYDLKWGAGKAYRERVEMVFDNPGNLYRILATCPGRGTLPISDEDFSKALAGAKLVDTPFENVNRVAFSSAYNLDPNFQWATQTRTHYSDGGEDIVRPKAPLAQLTDSIPGALDMVYLNDVGNTPDFGGASIASRLADVLALLEAHDKLSVVEKAGVNPESQEALTASRNQLNQVTARYATHMRDSVSTFRSLQKDHSDQVLTNDRDIEGRLSQNEGSKLLPEVENLLDGIDPLDEMEQAPRAVSISARNSGDSRTQGIQSR